VRNVPFDFYYYFITKHKRTEMARGMIVKRYTIYNKEYRSEGQSIIEYAMFIAVVVLALLAMQVYLKRGLQGKIRETANQISDGVLYNPNTTESNFTTRTSSRTESFYEEGEYSQNIVYDVSNRTGNQEVHPDVVEVIF